MLFYVVGGLRVAWVRILASIVGRDGGLRDCVCNVASATEAFIGKW